MDIKKCLEKEADKKYQKFSSSLLPNIDNILGVRLPILRKIAKEVYKNGKYEDLIKQNKFEYFEEIMLQAMIIGMLKKSPREMLSYVKDFIPKINNWSVCDCFCAGLKFTNKNKALIWDFLQPYFISNKEYDLRFAYVMSLSYFVTPEYIDEILEKVDNFRDERYYAKMAVAWLVSVCFVKEREKTLSYLKKSKLDKWTYNKSIQKICESYRVTSKDKAILKLMKTRFPCHCEQ